MNASKNREHEVSAAFIIARNLVFFLFSFMWSGSLAIIPQIFFASHYPADKSLLVSLFLFIGVIAAVMGVKTSQRESEFINTKRSSLNIVLLSFLVGGASFLALFTTKNLTLYFAAFAIFKFLSNYAYNSLDQYFVRGLPEERLGFYINVNIFFQLTGMVLGNFYFSFFYASTLIHSLLVLGLSAVAASAIFLRPGGRALTGVEGNEVVSRKGKLNKNDIYFLLYSALVMLGVMVFSAFLIYALKDYYMLENSEKLGGALLGMTSLTGALFIVLISFLGSKTRTDNKHLNMAAALILFAAGIILFYLRLSDSMPYLFALSISTGVGYGILIVSTRVHAARCSLKYNKPGLLSLYNNLPNYSMLGSFALTGLISAIGYYYSFNFFEVLFSGLIMIVALSAMSLFLFTKTSPAKTVGA